MADSEFTVIDASQGIDDVHAKIKVKIEKLISENYKFVSVHCFPGYQHTFRHYMRSKRSYSGAGFKLIFSISLWKWIPPPPC